ncbi:MAG: restriction endonuclease subunit S [Rubrivivax sp.]|nr:MAG: restriction endonuclease subunit S [Rubrivivax sp.]
MGELVRAGEAHLQTGPFGTQLSASEYVPVGIPVINVRNVGFGHIRADDLEYVSEAKAEQLHHHILRAGDIVFGRKGAVERHALIGPNQDGWVQGSDCLRLRLRSPSFSERFVSFYLRTQAHQDWMQALCSFGATMSSLNQDIVNRIQLPCPPRPIQERIAAILTTYDGLIANNQRRIALLESVAEEIYREWFVRMRFPGHGSTSFNKGLPSDWEPSKLGSIANFVMGQSPSSEHYNEAGQGLPFHQGVGTYGPRFPEHSVFCSVDGRLAKPGNILFSVRAPVGRLNIADTELIIGRGLAAMSHKQGFNTYLFYLLRTTFANEDMIGNGSIFNSVGKDELAGQPILKPNQGLIEEFERVVGPIDEQLGVLYSTATRLARIRDQLLPRLISGKLRIDHLDIQFPPSIKVDVPQAA